MARKTKKKPKGIKIPKPIKAYLDRNYPEEPTTADMESFDNLLADELDVVYQIAVLLRPYSSAVRNRVLEYVDKALIHVDREYIPDADDEEDD